MKVNNLILLSLVLILVMISLVFAGFPEYTRYEYYIGGGLFDDLGEPYKYSQSFTIGAVGPNENFILKGISFAVNVWGYPDNFKVGIYTPDEQDRPVDKLVEASFLIDKSDYYNLPLPDYNLMRGQKYVIVFSSSGTDRDNKYKIYRDDGGCSYPGGKALIWNGTSWNYWIEEGYSRCFNFELYGVSDEDSDGIQDSLDSCPDTLIGVEIDINGCSAEQFCNSFNPLDGKKDTNRKACELADWKNNEPVQGKGKSRNPRDCYIEKNIKNDPFDDICIVSSGLN